MASIAILYFFIGIGMILFVLFIMDLIAMVVDNKSNKSKTDTNTTTNSERYNQSNGNTTSTHEKHNKKYTPNYTAKGYNNQNRNNASSNIVINNYSQNTEKLYKEYYDKQPNVIIASNKQENRKQENRQQENHQQENHKQENRKQNIGINQTRDIQSTKPEHTEDIRKEIKKTEDTIRSIRYSFSSTVFIRKFTSVLINLCKIEEKTNYGEDYNYNLLNNKKQEIYDYKSFDFEYNLKNVITKNYNTNHWFNLIEYYNTSPVKNIKVNTQSIFQDLLDLEKIQKDNSYYNVPTYYVESALDFIKDTCLKRYGIENKNNKFVFLPFYKQYKPTSNQKYSAKELTNAFMKVYLSNIFFDQTILEHFYYKLLYIDKQCVKNIFVRIFSKVINVITKVHLCGFLSYCHSIRILDENERSINGNTGYELKSTELEFLNIVLFNKYGMSEKNNKISFENDFNSRNNGKMMLTYI